MPLNKIQGNDLVAFDFFFSSVYWIIFHFIGLWAVGQWVTVKGYGLPDFDCEVEIVTCPCGEMGTMVQVPMQRYVFIEYYSLFEDIFACSVASSVKGLPEDAKPAGYIYVHSRRKVPIRYLLIFEYAFQKRGCQ